MLPEDILINVFKYLAWYYDKPQPSFKSGLAVLATCREWRNVGMPIFCQTLYIEYSDKSIESIIDDIYRDNQTIANTTFEPYINSNVGLLAMEPYKNMVKSVYISVTYIRCPLKSMCKIVQYLQQHTRLLPARAIVIGFNQQHSRTNQTNRVVEPEQQAALIPMLGESFVKIMPRVTKMKFYASTFYTKLDSLATELISRYSEQLKSVDCSSWMRPSVTKQLCELEYMSFSHSGTDAYLCPQIHTDKLASVNLLIPSDAYFRQAFISNSEDGKVMFPRLTSLIVSTYQSSLHADLATDETAQLHFSNLKQLVIFNETPHSMLLNTAILPAAMNFISIHATLPIIKLLGNLFLPETKMFVLSVGAGNCSPGLLAAVNKVVTRLDHCCSVKLIFEDTRICISPATISGRNLTHLRLLAPMDISDIVALITDYPNIRNLDVKCSATHHNKWLARVFKNPDKAMPPIDTQLQVLVLTYTNRVRRSDAAIDQLLHLLQILPLLRRLVAPDIPEGPVLSFVKKHSSQFAHLANISFVLSLSGD